MSMCNILLKGFVSAVLVAGLSLFIGCGDHDHDDGEGTGTEEAEAEQEAHQHEVGPHGGVLLVVGDEKAHIEILHDTEAGKFTLYTLGADGKTALKIEEAPKLNLVLEEGNQQFSMDALVSEEGGTSQFEVVDDALKKEPHGGRIALTLEGTPYSVDLPHDHEH